MAFKTSFARVSIAQGLFSVGFTLAMVAIAWTLVVYFARWENSFLAAVAGSAFLYRPEWMMRFIVAGGLIATALSVVLIMLHALCATFISGVIAFLGVQFADALRVGTIAFKSTFPYLRIGASPRAERRINAGVTPQGRDLVKIPSNEVEITIQTADQKIYRNVFPPYLMRLRRAPLNLKQKPGSPVEKLEVALMEMLLAHEDYPADPSGHHANTSLHRHSIDVTKKLVENMPDEPLVRVVGLSHDIGKLLAYEPSAKNATGWEKKTQKVDRLSAQLIRLTPEFWGLDKADQKTLNIVLTYSHSPESMPRGSTTERGRRILKILRLCDGVTTHHEQSTSQQHQNDIDIVEQMRSRIYDVIAAMNINQVRNPSENADGWAQPANGFALVIAKRLREGFFGVLDAPTARAISLRSQPTPGQKHPANVALYQALRAEGLLIEEWRGFAPDMALFDAKIGHLTFGGLHILDLDRLQEKFADTMPEWGKSPYAIRIKKQTAIPERQRASAAKHTTQAAPTDSPDS